MSIIIIRVFDEGVEGEVVGIEQNYQTLCFIIEFGKFREIWSGKKVRQHSKSNSNTKTAVPSMTDNETVCTNEVIDDVPVLPSGYDYDDYDAVCGLARGYRGWGSSHFLIPSLISRYHSQVAKTKYESNQTFELITRALTLVGIIPDVQELISSEWLDLLLLLVKQLMGTPSFTSVLSSFDEEYEVKSSTCLQGVLEGTFSIERFHNLSSVLTGPKLLTNRERIEEDNVHNDNAKAIDGDSGFVYATEENEGVASRRRGSISRSKNKNQDDDNEEAEWAEEEDYGYRKRSRSDRSISRRDTPEMKTKLDESMISVDDRSTPQGHQRQQRGSDSACKPDDNNPDVANEYVAASQNSASQSSSPHQNIDTLDDKNENDEDDDDYLETVPNDVTYGDWEHRKLSRRKGREDALLTKALVIEVSKELETEGNELMSEGDLFQGVCCAVGTLRSFSGMIMVYCPYYLPLQ
jgi:hypothetical protein